MWDPEVVILTAPRIPEEEFKFQKKVTTEDGRLKISTEIYEDAKVIQEPYEMGGGMIATFADPDGNYFQLMTPWDSSESDSRAN